jgi:hypothetical protein
MRGRLMMSKKITYFLFTCVAIITFLSGCAMPVKNWEKEGDSSSQEQINKDIRDCEYQSKLATASAMADGSGSTGKAIGEGINIAEQRIELVNDCMENKNYKAVE